MAELSVITDHWTETVSDYILEQYRGASNWKAILKAVIDEYSYVEGQVWKLAPILDFKCRVKETTPTGTLLDFCAGIVGLERMVGETDPAFYARFVAEVGSNSAGTPDNIIYNSAVLSGDSEPQYIDETDCNFMVYTGPRNNDAVEDDEEFDYGEEGVAPLEGGADQLYKRQVKKLAAGGVLGIVGAAIQFEDGSLLGDAQGRLILMVADDSTVERTMVLATNEGQPIVNEQNVPIRAVVKGETVPTIPIVHNGNHYDAVRIKDLPDAGAENGYMVRDSETEGTTKTNGIGATGMKALWDATEPDEE